MLASSLSDLPHSQLAVAFYFAFLLLLLLFLAHKWHYLQFYITTTALPVPTLLTIIPNKGRRPPPSQSTSQPTTYSTIPHELKAHTRNTCTYLLNFIPNTFPHYFLNYIIIFCPAEGQKHAGLSTLQQGHPLGSSRWL